MSLKLEELTSNQTGNLAVTQNRKQGRNHQIANGNDASNPKAGNNIKDPLQALTLH